MHGIQLAELPEVAEFLVGQINGRPATTEEAAWTRDQLRHLTLDNPAVQPDVPPGWLVRDQKGAIVGAMMCCAYPLNVGERRVVGLLSHRFYVDASARGAGVGIFMSFAALGRRFPLFCNTAGGLSVDLWKRFKAYQINDQDHEMLGSLRPSGLVEELIMRRTRLAPLARAAGMVAMLVPGAISGFRARAAGGALDVVSNPAQAASLVPHAPEGIVTGARDEASLRWRYFIGPATGSMQVLAYSHKGGRALVVVDSSRRGHRSQIRSLTVADIRGTLGAGGLVALASTLAAKHKGLIDVITFRGLGPCQQHDLAAAGFRHRLLPAPTAWCIDKPNLLGTTAWGLVPGDNE